jgi:hypothetical protein
MATGERSGDDDAVAALLRRRASGALWLPVEGSSMGSAMVTGSLVRVVGAERPRIGEVWAFVLHREVIVHRCVGARGRRGVRFRGDARWPDDDPVPEQHLIGRVTEVRVGSLPPRRVPRRPVAVLIRSARRRARRVGRRLRLGRPADR